MASKETLGSLRLWVADIYGDDSSDTQIFYDRTINEAIDYVTMRFPFGVLNQSKTVTIASDGLLTKPALCQTIDSINRPNVSNNRGEEFFPKYDRPKDDSNRSPGKWYWHQGGKRTQGTQYRADVTQGSMTITKDQNYDSGSWYAEADVGKQLIILGQKGVFEITAVVETALSESVTVYPAVSMESTTAVTLEVDPSGQEIYELHNEDGGLFAGDIVIDFSEYHPTLVNVNDRLLIGAVESVKTYMLAMASRQSKYDVPADRLISMFEMVFAREVGHEHKEPERVFPEFNHGASLFQAGRSGLRRVREE